MEKITQTAGRNQLGDFAPDFAHFNDDILFGENWNNQDIDLKTRCILTVVALMSSGITDSSLVYHQRVQKIYDNAVKLHDYIRENHVSKEGFCKNFQNGLIALLKETSYT